MQKKLIIAILALKTLMTKKYFGKQLNLFSLKKVNTNENITLVENSNIIASEIEIAEKLNAFFSNIVKELNIKVKEDLLCDVSDINDTVERAIQRYKNHPSIQMIKEIFYSKNIFI